MTSNSDISGLSLWAEHSKLYGEFENVLILCLLLNDNKSEIPGCNQEKTSFHLTATTSWLSMYCSCQTFGQKNRAGPAQGECKGN